ncbi:MAG: PASTA domain-containing protein [Gemmatimonadetes bacterium]|nr:PASTA domain-containing protein [Gemmatimonadota bacterium]
MKGRDRRAGAIAGRRRLMLVAWMLGACVLVARAVQLQVLEGAVWREAALQQHRTSEEVPAARGTIVDRDGVVLAVSRETYRVSVAPHEVRDRDALETLLVETLDLSPREARRVTDPGRRWIVVPGRFPPSVREPLSGVRGVHLERQLDRFYPHGELARGLLGTVLDGEGVGGIEQAFDDLLRGTPGRQVLARDNVGTPIPGEILVVEPPAAGGEVHLTLDLDLQEIAHQALSEAVEKTGSRGGDLLVTDPSTGEILALVSMKDGRSDALAAINAPYEPGSTLKPFTVAALLGSGLASLEDSIDTGNGTWTVAGRTLHDVRGYGAMTLADALRHSSNVGVAMAASVLDPGTHYEALRDFGFGMETGIELPGEVPGLLRRPERWSAQSPVSLAIGYEIAVTPLQMAMAYGALANGGDLMEARLVRELRDARGGLVERREARRVRRAVPRGVTRELARVLVDVVEDGTGTAARLGTFRVAGKSGTSRAYGEDGYAAGRYFASFAGFFPADDPQLVIFVKLHAPRGAYYGGATAAPVTRATMEAVLAARRTPLDRRALIDAARRTSLDRRALLESARRDPQPVREAPGVRFAALTADARQPLPAPQPAMTSPLPSGVVRVPDISGLSPRAAVRRLHAVGLRVTWDGGGGVLGTAPGAGTHVAPGDTVLVGAAVGTTSGAAVRVRAAGAAPAR